MDVIQIVTIPAFFAIGVVSGIAWRRSEHAPTGERRLIRWCVISIVLLAFVALMAISAMTGKT